MNNNKSTVNMKSAIIGIGTNIGNRELNIVGAVKSLEHLPNTEICRLSPIYETEPWGFAEQENFYNACVKIRTELSPTVLLGACLGIESAFGRERTFKNAPRTLDMDLLLYENTEMNTKELILPHPGIGERPFVLVPLKDVLPNLKFGQHDYNKNWNECDRDTVKRL